MHLHTGKINCLAQGNAILVFKIVSYKFFYSTFLKRMEPNSPHCCVQHALKNVYLVTKMYKSDMMLCHAQDSLIKRHQDSLFAFFLRLPALRSWLPSDDSVAGLWSALCVTRVFSS